MGLKADSAIYLSFSMGDERKGVEWNLMKWGFEEHKEREHTRKLRDLLGTGVLRQRLMILLDCLPPVMHVIDSPNRLNCAYLIGICIRHSAAIARSQAPCGGQLWEWHAWRGGNLISWRRQLAVGTMTDFTGPIKLKYSRGVRCSRRFRLVRRAGGCTLVWQTEIRQGQRQWRFTHVCEENGGVTGLYWSEGIVLEVLDLAKSQRGEQADNFYNATMTFTFKMSLVEEDDSATALVLTLR